MITHKELLERLKYNPDLGTFTWLKVRPGATRAGCIAGGYTSEGYWRIKVCGKFYQAHRLAWLYMTKKWPAGEIDHIDGVKDNNCWANLRDTSHAGNAQNRWLTPRNKKINAPLGAYWIERDQRWRATIKENGKVIYLGQYKTAEDAHSAYLKAKKERHIFCPCLSSGGPA